MLSPTYEITTALSHTDELISPPYDIAIVTISYGRVTMSSVGDSMMSKKNMGWPFYAAVVLQTRLHSFPRATHFRINSSIAVDLPAKLTQNNSLPGANSHSCCYIEEFKCCSE